MRPGAVVEDAAVARLVQARLIFFLPPLDIHAQMIIRETFARRQPAPDFAGDVQHRLSGICADGKNVLEIFPQPERRAGAAIRAGGRAGRQIGDALVRHAHPKFPRG